MEEWFNIGWRAVIAILVNAVGIYIAIILFTRLAGKRSFSKMSSFDFAMTVAIGSMIASTVLSKNVSLASGILGLALIYGLQMSVAFFRRYKGVGKVVDNSPLMLMDGKNILTKNLHRAKVTEGDLRSKLREANVLNLSQVRAVIFEATGDISVLHSDSEDEVLEDWLLKDVER
ncbi:DUF421 domain-containing protein [Salinimicrobium tongyeongense]|uniref:DUF421 domain-containing protein n=1 Tax=Salinimicrobium tongyeongense TaxID=2809707 RepID=A0ABY6NNK9_9FLAO|nr:YetF domain-containing protein [Salinimicrobium tongyeongense]UZH54181.1 DUF421 domain-containing protein [Salinimicrobium tongyeongense]